MSQTPDNPPPTDEAELSDEHLPLTELESISARLPGKADVARQMRYFDAHLEQALALVLTGQCSVY